jgi:hypothetical protein
LSTISNDEDAVIDVSWIAIGWIIDSSGVILHWGCIQAYREWTFVDQKLLHLGLGALWSLQIAILKKKIKLMLHTKKIIAYDFVAGNFGTNVGCFELASGIGGGIWISRFRVNLSIVWRIEHIR